MTGPEHYRAAERLIERVTTGYHHDDGTPIIRDEPALITLAQAHATLALAAATAELDLYTTGIARTGTGRTDQESDAWAAVLTTEDDR